MLAIVILLIVKILILILVIVKIILSVENSVNISNFLNNECVNIYVTWHWLYNFILGWKDADVIDLNYKKECNVFV